MQDHRMWAGALGPVTHRDGMGGRVGGGFRIEVHVHLWQIHVLMLLHAIIQYCK